MDEFEKARAILDEAFPRDEHMMPEITMKQKWYVVDGPEGTDYIPDLVGEVDASTVIGSGEATRVEIPDQLKDYTANSEAYDITLVEGYGARLSASGYLDCTEWSVFDTPEEAAQYLADQYGQEEEEDKYECAELWSSRPSHEGLPEG